MSYDISFKVKAEGVDAYFNVGECDANITWDVGEMIRKSTGLEWNNEENNGLCVDVIPNIIKGYSELVNNPGKYKKYESPNGWGTVLGARWFFEKIIKAWEMFCDYYPELVPVATFWIE